MLVKLSAYSKQHCTLENFGKFHYYYGEQNSSFKFSFFTLDDIYIPFWLYIAEDMMIPRSCNLEAWYNQEARYNQEALDNQEAQYNQEAQDKQEAQVQDPECLPPLHHLVIHDFPVQILIVLESWKMEKSNGIHCPFHPVLPLALLPCPNQELLPQ